MNSGVYSTGIDYPSPGIAGSSYSYAPVPTRTLLDMSVAVPVTRSDGKVTWSLIATNLLNAYAPTFVGVPGIGRALMTRVRYAM